MFQSAFAEEAPDGQVHGVVGGDHVHAPDVDLFLDEPIANAVMRTWMTLDVSLLVRFFAEEGILVPAGVDEQNIAIVYVRAFFDIFWCEKSHIVEHITQVNDHAGTVAPLNGDLIDGLAFGHEMTRRIEMCPHVI